MPNPDGTRQVREFAGHYWSEQPPTKLSDLLEGNQRIAALYQLLVGPTADEPVVVEARPAAGTPGSRPSGSEARGSS